jgi:hypothetical protein
MAGRYDFVVKQGRRKAFTFTYKNADGTKQNLTGSTFTLSFKPSSEATLPVFSYTSADQIQGTDLANGTFTITFPETTSSYPPAIYVHDLKRVQNGVTYDDLEGTLALGRCIS